MFKTKPKKPQINVVLATFTVLALASLPIPTALAVGGSIARVNYYPKDQGTYDAVNYFLYQITAVNTNTTVSVSIDGGPPTPMIYQGTKPETVVDDTTAAGCYTWQTTVPAITAPGRHTFQFLSHYYVWQETDKYWAEFNAQAETHTFYIGSNQSDLLASLDPIASTSVLPQISIITQGALLAISVSAVVVVIASATFGRRGLKKRDEE